eukprot:gnl/TRDRNA2_/TRDRNA2_75418_c1_seq1.p1 gnl/TRDRNA2_/TRDRNA2_75418_c1~~gnl/TRDRNA2_/TRDRNA2_75418_c1_seq1.p1  ORF type:complete len:419 (+),score=74.22 gnl/TRDRNA2_/TRDRNA2_75418_c1_seq1:62-1258(+)
MRTAEALLGCPERLGACMGLVCEVIDRAPPAQASIVQGLAADALGFAWRTARHLSDKDTGASWAASTCLLEHARSVLQRLNDDGVGLARCALLLAHARLQTAIKTASATSLVCAHAADEVAEALRTAKRRNFAVGSAGGAIDDELLEALAEAEFELRLLGASVPGGPLTSSSQASGVAAPRPDSNMTSASLLRLAARAALRPGGDATAAHCLRSYLDRVAAAAAARASREQQRAQGEQEDHEERQQPPPRPQQAALAVELGLWSPGVVLREFVELHAPGAARLDAYREALAWLRGSDRGADGKRRPLLLPKTTGACPQRMALASEAHVRSLAAGAWNYGARLHMQQHRVSEADNARDWLSVGRSLLECLPVQESPAPLWDRQRQQALAWHQSNAAGAA